MYNTNVVGLVIKLPIYILVHNKESQNCLKYELFFISGTVQRPLSIVISEIYSDKSKNIYKTHFRKC